MSINSFSYSRQIAIVRMNAGAPFFLKLVAGFIFLFFVFGMPAKTFAKEWVMEDVNLKISFNDQSLILKVLDKRCKKIWEQYSLKGNLQLQKVSQKNNSIVLNFTGKYSFDTELTLSQQSELEIIVSANASMPMNELAFPAAFKSPAEHFLVLTDSEGMILPVEDKEYPLGNGITYYCGGGLSMAWMGVTDKDFTTGYMAILETPFDAALRPNREKGAVTFQPVWLASKEQFAYSRKVTYIFFDKGGYVAQCKRYRNYIWPKNKVVSLKDNAKKIPAIDKMVGGVHIYVWDNARNAAFSKELKNAGIDKAMFIWNPNHLPYPSAGYDDSLKALGYVAASYELFTDANPRDTAHYDLSTSAVFLKRNAFPGLFNQIVARKKDGTTYHNQFGHYTNPKAVFPEVMKRTTKEMTIWPHESFFVDVCQANGLYECYSKENPLTRQQWAEAHINTLQTMIDKHHVFLGAEWGADFAAAQSVYAHGMMTLQRTWFNTEIGKKGTIYYYGDWKNGQRPSIMLGERTAPPIYMKYSINEAIRVPLYELVYHDAVVTSWRWEDANHHTPEIWWKKDLFNILYGSAPLWSLDRDRWESFKNTFIESYKNICPWLQQIGYDEMVSHRFLSVDRKVQESVFSSGKKIIVNFRDTDFNYQNKLIKAKGFLIF
ncbi:MAG: glycoside hydrolase [Bacteroidota bacterium]|nr:glycoside hydrolase [Bacteroidota bacterium]